MLLPSPTPIVTPAAQGHDPAPPGRAVKIDNVRRERVANQVARCGFGVVKENAGFFTVQFFKMRLTVVPAYKRMNFMKASFLF